MTDIKELALRHAEAAGAKGFHWDGSLYDFVEPFLAAYLAEQEPVAYRIRQYGRSKLVWANHQMTRSENDGMVFDALFTAPPLPEPAPAPCTNNDKWNCKYCGKTETCKAINVPRNFGKPVCAPEDTNNSTAHLANAMQFGSDMVTKYSKVCQTLNQECKDADELLRLLQLDPETYRTDGGYINLPKVKAAVKYPEEYPHLSAPSSEEVREMVRDLRTLRLDEAADMIERLAARVPTTLQEGVEYSAVVGGVPIRYTVLLGPHRAGEVKP